MPELSNPYLTLPPVNQLYTPAPPQYPSSAPLGIPRVAQTTGSGYRYYENLQPVSHWMSQAQSQLEPMDSYVKSLFSQRPCIPLNVRFAAQFSHTQERFPAGAPSSDTQPNRYH